MQNQMERTKELIETVYCNHCHLATPIWRSRCLHCKAPLLSLVGKQEPAEMSARRAAGGRR